MPNIRQQIVGPLGDKTPSALPGDDIGIYIMASDGREITLTKRQIQTAYQLTTGNRNARRAATIQWVKDQIVAALGQEQVGASLLDVDFDEADGSPSRLVHLPMGV